MKKIGRKGFTLIELLAALVILGLLMAIAAPNIMSILNNQKNTIYVEDAKKLATAAGYRLRGTTDDSVKRPDTNRCTLMDLTFLDNGDFNDPPQGGAYFSNLSYVLICNQGGTYHYYVQLIECKNVSYSAECSDPDQFAACTATCNSSGADRGVKLVNITEFDDTSKKTKEFIDDKSNAVNNPQSSAASITGGSSIQYYCSASGCNDSSSGWNANTNKVLYDANDN